jgi:lipopolysaccharide export system permease protein
MTRIDRYIMTQVLQSMGVVLLVLTGLDLVFTLVDELGETEGQYGMTDAVRYVLYVFPRHVYELLPMTALIGSLVGLGILAAANELVVLQTAGVRVIRIVWSVMKPAILIMVVGFLLGEFIAPRLELQGELDRALARGEQVAVSRYGHWQRDDEEFMHFNAIDPDGLLHGVSIYRFNDDRELVTLINAEIAVFRNELGQGYWLLQQGSQTEFPAGRGMTDSRVSDFAEQVWDVDLSPDLLKVLIIDPDKMSMSDLYRYAGRFENQGLDGSHYFLSFWKKAMQPLTTAALVIVAVAFIFGPLRSATMGSKVFTAICFGIFFYLLQNLLSTVSLVYQLNPLLAVSLPVLFCLVIGLILLRRAA